MPSACRPWTLSISERAINVRRTPAVLLSAKAAPITIAASMASPQRSPIPATARTVKQTCAAPLRSAVLPRLRSRRQGELQPQREQKQRDADLREPFHGIACRDDIEGVRAEQHSCEQVPEKRALTESLAQRAQRERESQEGSDIE